MSRRATRQSAVVAPVGGVPRDGYEALILQPSPRPTTPNSPSAPDVKANCTLNQWSYNIYGVAWTPASISVLDNGRVWLMDHPIGGPAPSNEAFCIALIQSLG